MIRPLFFLTVILNFSVGATEITFSTWNIEWLTTDPNYRIKQSQRGIQDFQQLSEVFTKISSQSFHIMAFQEINSKKGLEKITGPNYQYFFSDRSKNKHRHQQFININQYTGFAISKGINVRDMEDINLTPSLFNKQRFAAYVVVSINQEKPIHLLSVHLKSGCFNARKNTKACKLIEKQAKTLNAWILEKQRKSQSFILLGDFNHNLAYPNDWLWAIITDNTQPKIELNSQKTNAACLVKSKFKLNNTYRYRYLIDHIISSPDLALGQSKQITFTKYQALNYNLSDHCPLASKRSL